MRLQQSPVIRNHTALALFRHFIQLAQCFHSRQQFFPAADDVHRHRLDHTTGCQAAHNHSLNSRHRFSISPLVSSLSLYHQTLQLSCQHYRDLIRLRIVSRNQNIHPEPILRITQPFRRDVVERRYQSNTLLGNKPLHRRSDFFCPGPVPRSRVILQTPLLRLGIHLAAHRHRRADQHRVLPHLRKDILQCPDPVLPIHQQDRDIRLGCRGLVRPPFNPADPQLLVHFLRLLYRSLELA